MTDGEVRRGVSFGRVRALYLYPLKGARGIALEQANVLATGLQHDRRFLVVDDQGLAVTQRTEPSLALVETSLTGDALLLSARGSSTLAVPLAPEGKRMRVRIWNDDVDAVVVPDGASFFTELVGRPCTLVHIPDDALRCVQAPYGAPGDRVGFADAFPVLVATLASLADLNARLATPVPMDRFRPNVVVDGAEPFAEDGLAAMRIGALRMRTPKRCARCQVVTIDQATAIASKEPLQTLARYRTSDKKVFFAMNAIPDLAADAAERITLGDDAMGEAS